MKTLMKCAVVMAVMTPATAVQAASAKDCGYQADVVEVIRQARIERVRERKVVAYVASTEPSWPERYNAAVPLMTPWVYEMKMADVRKQDLAAAWKELCLQQ